MDIGPASKVELFSTAELKEAVQNSRVHSEEQIKEIAASIKKFGFTIPVLADEDGVLIAGHARLRAAILIGMKQVPVMIATGWTEAQKEAYQIADNRLAEKSTWDETILADQMKRLNAMEFDLNVLGFDLEKFDLGDAFNPNLAPTADTQDVTAEAVEKTKAGLEGQFSGQKPVETYSVVCPECGEEFEVQL